jgi:hypothetical protein
MLNGYAIEGHVSAEIIEKLVKEHPADVVGISLPEMPLGLPVLRLIALGHVSGGHHLRHNGDQSAGNR